MTTRQMGLFQRPAKENRKKVLILGVGNILLKDEGLGVRAVELFKKGHILPKNVACVDGGTAGLSLIGLMKGFTHMIIVDAVCSNKPPGAVRAFDARKISALQRAKNSAHGIGVSELLALARFEGCAPKAVIVGMEPEDISPGLELTATVQEKLPEAIEAIVAELAKLGVNIRRRTKRA